MSESITPTVAAPSGGPLPEALAAEAPVVDDPLTRRLDGLAAVVDAGRDRLPDQVVAPAETVARRAGERLRLSGEHTIVALAGATGSGKSSLFNALTDLELAGVGLRRPTTSWALACAWGPDGAGELLEWMGIPPRHQVSRTGMLEHTGDGPSLEGLVLVDLPDHDSTEVAHHVEMDRLVQLADTLIWVLDPQKYADAAIHERYIKPMAGFGAVTLVVLNQIDRIPYQQRGSALDDVRRLLAEDGLPDVKVIGVSATRGDGIDDLRAEIAARITSRTAARHRLLADIGEVARDVADTGGSVPVPQVPADERDRFVADLADGVGVPQIVDAVDASTRRRALQRTAWPPAGWARGSRDRRDPLGLGDELGPAALARAAAPGLGQVQQATVDLAIRDSVERIAHTLTLPWRTAVRRAAQSQGRTIAPALDESLAATDLELGRPRLWWRLVQVVQWLLLLVAAVALVWAIVLGAQAVLDLGSRLPDVGGALTPVLVLVGALVLGIVLEVGSRVAAARGSRRQAAKADQAFRGVVASVADDCVLAPVQTELDRYRRYRDGLLAALD